MHTLVPALGRLRQADHCILEASLVYVVFQISQGYKSEILSKKTKMKQMSRHASSCPSSQELSGKSIERSRLVWATRLEWGRPGGRGGHVSPVRSSFISELILRCKRSCNECCCSGELREWNLSLEQGRGTGGDGQTQPGSWRPCSGRLKSLKVGLLLTSTCVSLLF